jgi:hypothetical protein
MTMPASGGKKVTHDAETTKPSAQTSTAAQDTPAPHAPDSTDADGPSNQKPTLTPLQTTLQLARRGNPAILPRLRATLAEHPEIWQHYGDLAACVERQFITLIGQKDLLIVESVTRRLAALREELGGGNRVEKLIVERIVSAWLQVQYAEMAVAACDNDGIQMQQFRLKQLESADRRFHAACRNLAMVRRLLGGVELRVSHTHNIAVPQGDNGKPSPVPDNAASAGNAVGVRRQQLFGNGVPMLKEEMANV